MLPKIRKYLTNLGITHIDYMIISHHHKDHFGCTKAVLDKFPLRKASYDRPSDPESATATYDAYVEAVGNKRKHVNDNTLITLDAESNNPVTINIAGFNGAGVQTTNENDQSVAAVVHVGEFDVMMAGDLSGFQTPRYKDIETAVSKRVGQVEVLKINHHGSDHSSDSKWLAKLKPCRSLRAESESAIVIYQHFAETDPTPLYGLVSPKIVKWINGELEEPEDLLPLEPAAREGGRPRPSNANELKLYQLSR